MSACAQRLRRDGLAGDVEGARRVVSSSVGLARLVGLGRELLERQGDPAERREGVLFEQVGGPGRRFGLVREDVDQLGARSISSRPITQAARPNPKRYDRPTAPTIHRSPQVNWTSETSGRTSPRNSEDPTEKTPYRTQGAILAKARREARRVS